MYGGSDSQSENLPEGLAAEYQMAARSLLNRYSWSLLDADELARRATELVARSGGRQDAGHACLQAYAAEMHRVIMGDDAPLADQAFGELRRWLVRMATGKVGRSLGEELAQQALVAVWEKRQQCRHATSFLSWATMIVINCVRQQFRRESRPAADRESTTQSDSERARRPEPTNGWHSYATGREWLSGKPAVDQSADAGLMRQEAYWRLLETLRAVLPSEDQVRVIVALFLEERSPAELAQELSCTVHNVYVLKARAMSRLRGNRRVIRALFGLVQTFPQRVGERQEDEEQADS